ncbi:MAG: hypothetical protein GWQ05_05165 [Verrucomicrobiaceae bacterium]|nr:hypothetical protein [Verrucomicrobiaceae bacterium]NCF90335.1 hypothetical protein [Verrucomicrobiaceae bacterium]
MTSSLLTSYFGVSIKSSWPTLDWREPKDAPELTVPGTIPGTPKFMAPEQIEEAKVDHHAALFALGCLLQFIATG